MEVREESKAEAQEVECEVQYETQRDGSEQEELYLLSGDKGVGGIEYEMYGTGSYQYEKSPTISKTFKKRKLDDEQVSSSQAYQSRTGLVKKITDEEMIIEKRNGSNVDNRENSTTTYYFKPTTNKSATVRVRKANFLHSPYTINSHRKGFTFGGKHVEKQKEELPGPGMYEHHSKAVEGPEYTIKGKYKSKLEAIPGPGEYDYKLQTNTGWTMGGRAEDAKSSEFPGPGAYDSQFQKEGVQYSIAAKREAKIEQTPGPGDYEQIKEAPKGVVINKSTVVEKVEDLPGPGMYDRSSFISEGPQYSMFQRRSEKVEMTPGPGDYESKIHRKQGVTIGKKYEEKEKEVLPGPGNYELKSTINDGPQFSILKKHDQRIEQTPGPGEYEAAKEKKEGITIGQKIIEKAPEEMPGPGNYTEKSFIVEGPKYSIYQRRDDKIEQTPGPGDYEEIIEKKGGVTIGEKLTDKAPEDLPGPGTYTEKSHIVEGPQYSIYQKREVKIEQTPGPGEYEEEKLKMKGITIGEKLQEKEAEELPGPGNYEDKTYIGEGAQYSIYQRREQRIEQTPGPGDYEELKEKKGGITISERLQDRAPEDLPGPGNYDEKTYIGEGNKYSIYHRREERIEQTPGPGDYEDLKEKKGGITIGERLKEKEAEELPGPGNYEEKTYIGEGNKYSIYQKREQRIEQTPGPGDYDELRETSKGVTIGMKLQDKAPEELPGPGEYKEKSYIVEGPQFSIFAKREQSIEQTPGPGDYEDLKEKKGGITIGERLKEKEGEDLPGPGNYTEKSYIIDGPKYSIYQRREQRIEKTPGPGDYNEPEKEMKGITIGTSEREREVQDSEPEPGPGHYKYYNPQLEGKGVSFTREIRDKNYDNSLPGPGNYNGVQDWAPGYGYEMSVSAKQFEEGGQYEIIREVAEENEENYQEVNSAHSGYYDGHERTYYDGYEKRYHDAEAMEDRTRVVGVYKSQADALQEYEARAQESSSGYGIRKVVGVYRSEYDAQNEIKAKQDEGEDYEIRRVVRVVGEPRRVQEESESIVHVRDQTEGNSEGNEVVETRQIIRSYAGEEVEGEGATRVRVIKTESGDKNFGYGLYGKAKEVKGEEIKETGMTKKVVVKKQFKRPVQAQKVIKETRIISGSEAEGLAGSEGKTTVVRTITGAEGEGLYGSEGKTTVVRTITGAEGEGLSGSEVKSTVVRTIAGSEAEGLSGKISGTKIIRTVSGSEAEGLSQETGETRIVKTITTQGGKVIEETKTGSGLKTIKEEVKTESVPKFETTETVRTKTIGSTLGGKEESKFTTGTGGSKTTTIRKTFTVGGRPTKEVSEEQSVVQTSEPTKTTKTFRTGRKSVTVSKQTISKTVKKTGSKTSTLK